MENECKIRIMLQDKEVKGKNMIRIRDKTIYKSKVTLETYELSNSNNFME